MNLIYILIGLVGLYFGGEGLVRGAVSIAERMGVSKLVIGLTIVGMGTSAPELLVSLKAALGGSSDIALGNVVGSNIANILLILGVSAVVYPIMQWDKNVRRDVVVALGAALLVLYFAQSPVIGRVDGIIMLAGLGAYLFYVFTNESKAIKPEIAASDVAVRQMPLWQGIAFMVGGMVLLIVGADYLVEGAVNIARAFGISETVIGLTIVAVGTSLPELATSITAALKRQSDVALGNVVGSNIFNILGILGITTLVKPVGVAQEMAGFDVPVMVITTILLVAVLFTRTSITKRMGQLMVGLYAAYTLWLFV
jgi:cation:H+ antiporter